jgi:hypothetical protein
MWPVGSIPPAGTNDLRGPTRRHRCPAEVYQPSPRPYSGLPESLPT